MIQLSRKTRDLLLAQKNIGGPKCNFCIAKGHKKKKECSKFHEWLYKKENASINSCYEVFTCKTLLNTWWIDIGVTMLCAYN